jgi:hypothetical protein
MAAVGEEDPALGQQKNQKSTSKCLLPGQSKLSRSKTDRQELATVLAEKQPIEEKEGDPHHQTKQLLQPALQVGGDPQRKFESDQLLDGRAHATAFDAIA